ncbi:TRAP transporter large permease [Mammaliicoccus sciuri]|nr:TRAP transporter large permease [Sporosarcina newyorkensis]
MLLFFLLIALGIPIAFALGLTGVIAFILTGDPLELFVQRMFTGLDSFTLVAIPLFILAGELMDGSGILIRLLNLARLFVGRIKGGLLYVTTLATMFFGGVNGSAVADASAVGSMLIPTIDKEYKDPELAAAITASGAIVGPIIPPSLPMLIYAFSAANVSVAALFLAGIIPGILLALGMMIVTFFIARKRNFPSDKKKYTISEVLRILRGALVAAVLPIIMVVGIVAGIVTPTEAGCVGVIYALAVGFLITKELTLKKLHDALGRTVMVSTIVMILISVGNSITWWITIQGVPNAISTLLQNTTQNAVVFLMLMFIIYLIVGFFIEQSAAIIMFVPVFAPLAMSYGIDPVHFGLFTCLVLALGLITPPVGICVFITSSIAKIPIERGFKASVPYMLSVTAVIILVTIFPQIYMWLPNLLLSI